MENRTAEFIKSKGREESGNVIKKLMAIGATGALALGLSACESNNKPEESVTTTESLSQMQTEEEQAQSSEILPLYTETLPEGEELREIFYIPSGLSDEDLAKTTLQRLSAWENFAATDEMNTQIYNDEYVSMKELTEQVAIKSATDIIPALFSESFIQENQELLDGLTGSNTKTIRLHYITNPGSKPEDIEAYRTWIDFESVESFDASMNSVDQKVYEEGDRAIGISYIAYDNSNLNRAYEVESFDRDYSGGQRMQMNVWFVDGGDGRMYIDDINANYVD